MDERTMGRQQLVELLREAESAHAEYERGLGHRDDNWPEWYVDYIFTQLAPQRGAGGSQEAGDRIPSSEPYLSE